MYIYVFLIQVAEYTALEEQLQKTLRDLDKRERQLLTAESEVKSLLSLYSVLIARIAFTSLSLVAVGFVFFKLSYGQSCDLCTRTEIAAFILYVDKH